MSLPGEPKGRHFFGQVGNLAEQLDNVLQCSATPRRAVSILNSCKDLCAETATLSNIAIFAILVVVRKLPRR